MHPRGRSLNDYRAVLLGTTAHTDRISRRVIVGSRIFHGEVLVEYLSDDSLEHGLGIDAHSASLSQSARHDCHDWSATPQPVKMAIA